MGRKWNGFEMLIWIEEPLDTYDIEGHARLAAALDNAPIATGNADQFPGTRQLILGNASDFVQPDAPRVSAVSLSIPERLWIWRRNTGVSWRRTLRWKYTCAFRSVSRAKVAGTFRWLNPLFNEQQAARWPHGFPIVMVWVFTLVKRAAGHN